MYKFSDSFIFIFGNIRVYFHLSYRQIYRSNHRSNCRKEVANRDKPPSYSKICQRPNKLDIDINDSMNDDFVIISIVNRIESKLQTKIFNEYKINWMWERRVV